MSNSYRIRTTPGVDKSVKVTLEQDFEFLEILSLKVLQSQVYTRVCSDYGVIVGRVSVNNGFGIPNAKVSVFIPLEDSDSGNPVITELYPYKTLSTTNDDGYRYNLLPTEPSYSNHIPTGSFFTREDVLTNPNKIEVYDKYYKYNAVTNESGDYMIFGVPVGSQTIVVNVDLSDIGEFSLSPQDLIRMGRATESQVSGTKFKSSANLNELPQIITINRTLDVEPFWGDESVCTLGITRTDFDLSDEANIDIRPTAIFMGSILSTNDDYSLKANCRPALKSGELCSLVVGPGEILAIRQTIDIDNNGRPILEEFKLESGGKVIDDNGTWLIDVPMNLDYVVINEFGERVLSNDPKVGIPTKGKYRFKVKWGQPPTLSESVKRAYFLVPNIKEYGWVTSSDDPLYKSFTTDEYERVKKSYTFSLNWDDYGSIDNTTGLPDTIGLQMIQEAIDCEDRFYDMTFNKVYTVSQMITQYRKGTAKRRFISIKDIVNDTCESENYKFPTNDAYKKTDILFLVFTIFSLLFRPTLYVLVLLLHILSFIVVYILVPLLTLLVRLIQAVAKIVQKLASLVSISISLPNFSELLDKLNDIKNRFTNFKIPNLTYPDCELCDCNDPSTQSPDNTQTIPGSINQTNEIINTDGSNLLLPISNVIIYNQITGYDISVNELLSGYQIPMTGNIPNYVGTPYPIPNPNNANSGLQTDYYFTSDLPLSERLNLFNTKSKYFNNVVGGGVNQIKVKFDTVLNPSPSKYHLDNVMVVMVSENQINKFSSGQILSFQDVKLSGDININTDEINDYGTNSITGSTLLNDTIITQKTITYSDPNGGPTYLSVVYNLTGKTSDNECKYARYPVDIEYFQVITGVTYNNYTAHTDTSLVNSLNTRFLNNDTYINTINSLMNVQGLNNGCATNQKFVKPINLINGYEKKYIVFLVRGVDPNSTRVKCEYDLSKLFGYNNWGYIKVSGLFKLNIPIQGTPLNIKHTVNDNNTIDTYSNLKLFYPSMFFQPGNQMSGFTTSLPKYYSNLDNTTIPSNLGVINDVNYGLKIKNDNDYTLEWVKHTIDTACNVSGDLTYAPIQTQPLNNSRTYIPFEPIEGGSFMYLNVSFNHLPFVKWPTNQINISYYSRKYNNNVNILPSNNLTNNIVMRSDRLPTSTMVYEPKKGNDNSYLLNSNPITSVYLVSDDGFISSSNNVTNEIGDDIPVIIPNPLLNSFSCNGLVPLNCYYNSGGTVKIQPSGNSCYKHNDGNLKLENGCYILVTTPIKTLLSDFSVITEWLSRLTISFAACRNVFGHIFTNNWVNGTLYAFSFKNNRYFNSKNVPYSVYCKDNLFFDNTETYNFYYRCSPWDFTNKKFIGKNSPGYDGNEKNLLYPTTIMDLGPRDFYSQEIALSNNFDGYVMKNLNNTSFGDVSEILNLFIITRLTNSSFIQKLIAGTTVDSFFSRKNRMIDGDYAQMISINSEVGVTPFEAENYPNPNQIYYNGGASTDGVFGIFFSSDTQVRDYLTPKRTINVNNLPITNSCSFEYIPVKSQIVPFYQWDVKQNSDGDSIFGSQLNNWFTNEVDTNGFFSSRYQSMDRIQPVSRYFRGNNMTQTNYYKGYIYSVDNSGNLSGSVSNWNQNSGIYSRAITNGAPFHFFFGLKRGKSAFDRFTTKWIDTTNEND